MDPSALPNETHPSEGCTQTSENLKIHSEHNRATINHSFHERNRHGWRRVVLNFTPSWYSVTMGTGIASILLQNLPYNGVWLYYISVLFFCLNIFLFCLFTFISVLRYTMFEGLWGCMVRHPVQSLFLGTIPMGLATIINMIVFVCVPAWGHDFLILAWVLWWIDVVLAVGTNFYLPFIIMYKHESALSTMTAAWLLPVVSTIVAAASGSILSTALLKSNAQHALYTLLLSYILLGCGLALALFILVIYFQRLTTISLPPREVIVSVFLPLGPFGQGAFALLNLGKAAALIFPLTHTAPSAPMLGQVFYASGLLLGLMMWGFGLVWLFFAIASISKTRFPFNIGWWGFTFPLGVFSVATTTLAAELPSLFFKVLGTIFSLIVVALWCVVAAGTLKKSSNGELFHAPCLASWEQAQVEKMGKKGEGV